MTDEPRDNARDLIQRHLDGDESPSALNELQRLIATRPDVADAFARATRLDSALHDLSRSAAAERRAREVVVAGVTRLDAASAPAVGRSTSLQPTIERRRWLAVAAAVILVIGAGIVLFRLSRTAPDSRLASSDPNQAGTTRPSVPQTTPTPPDTAMASNRVLSGSVTTATDGRPVTAVTDGEAIRIEGRSAAVLRLADGSEVDFDPGTRAVLHGTVPGLRQLVELSDGAGTFRVEKGGGQFQVQAGGAQVTALGTAFSVRLPGGEGPRRLAVAVLEGTVQVDFDSRTLVMAAGDNRVFTPGTEGRGGPADVRGILRTVQHNRIVVDTGKDRRNADHAFDLSGDAKVTIDGRPAAVEELRPGMLVLLQRLAGDPAVVGVRAEGATVFGEVRSVDAAAGTVTLAGRVGKESGTAPDVTYRLAADVRVSLDGTPTSLDSIGPNRRVSLRLSALDGKTVVSVAARVKREGERRE